MRYLTILSAILKQPRYAAAMVAVTWCVATAAVWLPNLSLIVAVFQSSATVTQKLVFLGTLYQSISTNFSVVSATYTLLIAILFGLQISLLYFYIRRVKSTRVSLRGAGGAGVGGLLAGALGIGCAACGTFILTSLLTLVGAAGFVTLLPLHGQEFGFIGVALLGYSIWLLLRKIAAPDVCPV